MTRSRGWLSKDNFTAFTVSYSYLLTFDSYPVRNPSPIELSITMDRSPMAAPRIIYITSTISCELEVKLASENSRRFTRSPLEPSQNDVWVTSAEIPYWWRVTTQILVVLLIGWKNFLSTNQKHYQDLGSDTSSVWNFCARYSDVVLRGLKWRPRETAVFKS